MEKKYLNDSGLMQFWGKIKSYTNSVSDALQGQIDDKQRQITANDEDISLLQTRSTQMEQSINNIAVTGGASVANTVTYSNTASGLVSINAQGAIDELAAKNATKAEKAEVTAELEKKFDKANITQETGKSDSKVMSQKAVSDKLIDLLNATDRNYSNYLETIGKEVVEVDKYEEVSGELYMDSSGEILEGYQDQFIRYIKVKCGDHVIISSKDSPFDDNMIFASAAFFTELPQKNSIAKEIIAKGGNYTLDYLCRENGYVAVWQKYKGKAKIYTANAYSYKLVQAKEEGVLVGYYMSDGNITTLADNKFKVHYFAVKKGDSVYMSDNGHSIGSDYNFSKAVFIKEIPHEGIVGTVLIGKDDENSMVYNVRENGYIAIQERNPSQLMDLYNRVKYTLNGRINDLEEVELAKKFDKANITQETGKSDSKVMSQKAVSDKLIDLLNATDRNYSNYLETIGKEVVEVDKYEEVSGELYMDSSGEILEGYQDQFIRYIKVKCGDHVIISSKDSPFDDNMIFASAAFFTELPQKNSIAKEIIAKGGNYTLDYLCRENGYVAVWQKYKGKAKIYTANAYSYKLVQAKEEGVLVGYYMSDGNITTLADNKFKVHYFAVKKGDSVYMSDNGHSIGSDYNFSKAVFIKEIPHEGIVGTVLIGKDDENSMVYNVRENGYIAIQERNPDMFITLFNRQKQTIIERIYDESSIYDVNEHTTYSKVYGLTATKQRASIQFHSADAANDVSVKIYCGGKEYTAVLAKTDSVSKLASELKDKFSSLIKGYSLLWCGGATVIFTADDYGDKHGFAAQITSSSATITVSVNEGLDSALDLVPYTEYKKGSIIRFRSNYAKSSGVLNDRNEHWIYTGDTPNDFHNSNSWELLGSKVSYEGKLLTSIGDSTSGMERWQPFVCKELCCNYTASAISGGTLNDIYKSTVSAISVDSDFVTVQYGTNDWADESLHLGELTDMADGSSPTTFCGALNYVCKWLSENIISQNPYCRVLMWTPLQRNDGISKRLGFLYGYDDITKEAKNKEGKTLADYSDVIIKIAGIWGFSVLDTHRKCGFNRITIGTWNENYIASNDSKYEDYNKINSIDGNPNFTAGLYYDGLHPNYEPAGRILGHMIAEALKRI